MRVHGNKLGLLCLMTAAVACSGDDEGSQQDAGFGIFVSKIKETMTLEDPETTIERLYHDMYGADLASANDQ